MSNATYINFFPGDMNTPRSLTINNEPEWAIEDLPGLMESIVMGCTSSCAVEDRKAMVAALEDGDLLRALFGDNNLIEVQDAVEELHALLPESGAQYFGKDQCW